jgi:hypothetical protein
LLDNGELPEISLSQIFPFLTRWKKGYGMVRCEICKQKMRRVWYVFGGKTLCDGCHCEYRAVFLGDVSAKRKRRAQKEKEKEPDGAFKMTQEQLHEEIKRVREFFRKGGADGT